jgi:hypothetical protein
MSNRPIKAASAAFTSAPFYLIQASGTDKRYVVSLGDKVRIRTLLAGFVNQAAEAVQVKIRDLDNRDEPVDYYGRVNRSALHSLMTKYEDVIFHDGHHDLMLKVPETDEYVVFDEHGLIFLYTGKDYSEPLDNLHAVYSPNEQLIYEFDHWHYRMANGREQLKDLIEELGLRGE